VVFGFLVVFGVGFFRLIYSERLVYLCL
jgi:hypothetical protein